MRRTWRRRLCALRKERRLNAKRHGTTKRMKMRSTEHTERHGKERKVTECGTMSQKLFRVGNWLPIRRKQNQIGNARDCTAPPSCLFRLSSFSLHSNPLDSRAVSGALLGTSIIQSESSRLWNDGGYALCFRSFRRVAENCLRVAVAPHGDASHPHHHRKQVR